jgi:UDP-N-acetylmuramate--alanine ligase
MTVVFQPHRYSRTRALFEEFLTAFLQADELILTDIYPASEEPIPGVTAQNLGDAIRRRTNRAVTYLPDFDAIVAYLLEHARPGDVILTPGAGSVWKVGEAFLEKARRP